MAAAGVLGISLFVSALRELLIAIPDGENKRSRYAVGLGKSSNGLLLADYGSNMSPRCYKSCRIQFYVILLN